MPWLNKREPNCMAGIVPPAPRGSGDLEDRRRDVYSQAAWKRLRAAKLADQPLCEICLLAGKYIPADHVHHLRTFTRAHNPEARVALAFDYDNLCSIKDEVHSKYHAICEARGVPADHTPEEIYRIIKSYCESNRELAPWDRL